MLLLPRQVGADGLRSACRDVGTWSMMLWDMVIAVPVLHEVGLGV